MRGFSGTAGAVGFGTFSGDAFAVQGRLLKQVESLGRESEFRLWDRQGGCKLIRVNGKTKGQ
ncbi:MAG: hypothetical protein ACYDH9_20255 [Limisphaerales bacterium]